MYRPMQQLVQVIFGSGTSIHLRIREEKLQIVILLMVERYQKRARDPAALTMEVNLRQGRFIVSIAKVDIDGILGSVGGRQQRSLLPQLPA
ncbi:hypothetical protein N7451_012047 [Penicillium sp. IBT 35674x]|nr:hypothetical protein N7451_012047 [Penicillium sp. IBT 35674x]